MFRFDDNDNLRRARRQSSGRRGTRVPVRPVDNAYAESAQKRPEAPSTPSAEELEELKGEAAEWKDKYTRLYAEQENRKKRLERNYANRIQQEKEQLLRDFLPLADNLERALAHAPESEVDKKDGLRQGVELTLKAFMDVLARHDVKPIEAQGQPFDPDLHEAVGAVPHPELPPGTVAHVELKGYTFRDRLLRPARVLVTSQ